MEFHGWIEPTADYLRRFQLTFTVEAALRRSLIKEYNAYADGYDYETAPWRFGDSPRQKAFNERRANHSLRGFIKQFREDLLQSFKSYKERLGAGARYPELVVTGGGQSLKAPTEGPHVPVVDRQNATITFSGMNPIAINLTKPIPDSYSYIRLVREDGKRFHLLFVE